MKVEVTHVKKVYVLSFAVTMAFTASAGVITFNPATGGTAANGDQTVGWQFNVLSPLTVTGLDWYDSTGTGLNTAHTVGIWSPAGSLLTSTLIPAGAAAPLDGMFRFESIAPVNLPAGNGYIVGGQNFAASTDLLACGSGGTCDGLLAQAVDPRLEFVNATFSNIGGGFTEPTFFSLAHEGFYGPSFSAAPVPEPSPMVLLAIGLIGVGLAIQYRKQRTT
jgi:hypothetical protein